MHTQTRPHPCCPASSCSSCCNLSVTTVDSLTHSSHAAARVMRHGHAPLCADTQHVCPSGNALPPGPPLQELQRQSQAVQVQLQGLAAELEQVLAEEADKATMLAGGLAVGRWGSTLPFLSRGFACSDSLVQEPGAA